jgi:hypothetical protein
VTTTLTPPKKLGVTHWSTRLLAKHLGTGDATVAKAWRNYGVQPWRTKSFRSLTDPELVTKVVDVVGLHLAPPDNAIVLSVDEKSQIRALDRTMPILPMQPGLIERRSHDYVRHGTTTLFAALEIATGRVTAALKPRHRHQEILAFPKQVARGYPEGELHPAMDNYAAHKHPAVRAWLKANPRIVGHFAPTHASWMNLVEVWFLDDRASGHPPRRLRLVKDLNAKIRAYIDGWNDRRHPFVWTKTDDEILEKAPTANRLQTRGTSGSPR